MVRGGVTTHTMGREVGRERVCSVPEVLPPFTGISDVSSVYWFNHGSMI